MHQLTNVTDVINRYELGWVHFWLGSFWLGTSRIGYVLTSSHIYIYIYIYIYIHIGPYMGKTSEFSPPNERSKEVFF